MAKTISLTLLGNTPTEQREELRQRFVASEDILNIVKNVLQDKLDSDVKTRKLINNYSLPAWSEYQADGIGYQRALKEIIDLLTYRE